MHLVLSFAVHKKVRVQYPYSFPFQVRADLLLQTLVSKHAVLQLFRRTADHICKCIHLNGAPFPALGNPVNPDHILPRFMESLQHLPQKSGSHNTPLLQLSFCLRVQFIAITVHCRQYLVSHLVGVDKVLSPAPGTLFTVFADLSFHFLEHFLYFFATECFFLFFQF